VAGATLMARDLLGEETEEEDGETASASAGS